LKRLKSRILLLLLLATFSSSSCSFILPKKIFVQIPERPQLEECERKPSVQGSIVDGNVVLKREDADRLRDWIASYQTCTQSNEVRLEAHVQKLENRLKALIGG
jgi:hypothetical protein